MISQNLVSSFVKYQRSELKLTQEELAAKSGVGLRFIRDLEQGKESVRMDKVNQVLQLFGYTVSPAPARKKDAYEILLNYTRGNIRIRLKSKINLKGFIIDAVREGGEIKAWKFVPNNKAVEFRKTENKELLKIIPHDDIEDIENV
jgi:y4mF family transcriptional regulator